MLGYWRQAEATQNCLIGGRLHTGDLGWMDADGFLYFVDRLEEVISVHGYKVYPRNVEDTIRQHPAVIDVAVIGVPDPIRGQSPKAYVVLTTGTQLSQDGLQAFLADKLSPLEIPALFRVPRRSSEVYDGEGSEAGGMTQAPRPRAAGHAPVSVEHSAA